MTIEVKVTGETAGEVLDQMGGFVASSLVKQRVTPAPTDTSAGEMLKKETGGRTRTSRKAETKPEPQPDTQPETTEAPAPGIEDLRKKLKHLGEAEGHGHEAVYSLLSEFKVKKASEVPAERYV